MKLKRSEAVEFIGGLIDGVLEMYKENGAINTKLTASAFLALLESKLKMRPTCSDEECGCNMAVSWAEEDK